MSLTSEFVLTDRDFARVQALVKSRAGIDLGEGKRALVYSRLSRRLRALGISSFESYLSLLEQPSDPESGEFLNAITTNVTAFFREVHHFDLLRDDVLPALWRSNATTKRLRIWSAGCSTGEEPYSIALTVLSCLPPGQRWDVRILATDIDTTVLSHAYAGQYLADRTQAIPDALLRRYFEPGQARGEPAFTVRPELRDLLTFKQLNLLGPWPMHGPFDLIFCRNVIIYFDGDTRLKLVQRYRDVLRPDGHLFLGHSESLVGHQAGMRTAGKTVYRNDTRPAAAHSRSSR